VINDKAHSGLFGSVIQGLLSEGIGFRFRAQGRSMHPTIRDGEILHVMPVAVDTVRNGDIVLFVEMPEL
jgi:phage repressor protein C with HTH and peptisase S24 domain